MRIRDEIRLGVGALLAIQVLTMVAAVALLARMTPAIDQILEDNDKSIRAVERMLLALAEPQAEPGELDLRREHFERALAEAEGNITEPSEEPVLVRIVEQHEAALAGDPGALATVRAELWQLGDINRQSMLRANERAKRLGTAGAWALVFLGLIGTVSSIALMRRFRIKLINPVYELGSVLEACSGGDSHRRFNPGSASKEFHEVAEVVNTLVTEHFSQRERDWESVAKLDRLALLRLLDAQPEPTLVCEPAGAIAAANDAALELLGGSEGAELRRALARACGGEGDEAIRTEPLHDAGWLCRLGPQRDVSDTSGSLGSVGSFGSVGAPVSADSLEPGPSTESEVDADESDSGSDSPPPSA